MTTDRTFGRPALVAGRPPAPPPVCVGVRGLHRVDRGPHVVAVEVAVGPVAFTCLSRWGRVVGPALQGEPAVRITDRALALEVFRLVVGAAARADARGWGP